MNLTVNIPLLGATGAVLWLMFTLHASRSAVGSTKDDGAFSGTCMLLLFVIRIVRGGVAVQLGGGAECRGQCRHSSRARPQTIIYLGGIYLSVVLRTEVLVCFDPPYWSSSRRA